MTERLILLSDIHGNLSALEAVIEDFVRRGYAPDGIAILGDIINYGMRPNEVIARLKKLEEQYAVPVNIFGNHEKAMFDGDTVHFSTDRGRAVLNYTRAILTGSSVDYLSRLDPSGRQELEICGKRVLFLHGSLEDPFWGKLNSDTLADERYSAYDYVISGHSHIPHLIEYFFRTDNPEYRDRRRTVFINPGSVGQPRNHNPKAQYAYIDLKEEIFHFNSVTYDINCERTLFNESVDRFYSERLTRGI